MSTPIPTQSSMLLQESIEAQYARELNPAQLEAVTYCDGPSLVIAGAGSGKTRVLTYKIAYLLEKGVEPWNILALTFTNKAANEMNRRIQSICGGRDIHALQSGTFHSIFARILRIEHEMANLPADYSIYDSADSRSLIKAIVKELELDEKKYKPAVVAGRISEAKNHLILPQSYCKDQNIARRDHYDNLGETGKIYTIYQTRLRQAGALDFDDLLLQTYLLLHNNATIRQHYQTRFRYILVDEYQDTNMAQHRILAELTRPDSCICVVGDDAQSIYGFRGADINNILQFTRQYPSARLIKLECNYRSTQTIVEAANSIIRHNAGQIPKKIYSAGQKGDPICLFSAYSDKEEASKVAAKIIGLHRRRGIEFSEIALLYRTIAQSHSFEKTFQAASIPYRIYGGLSFYQRKEIKDVLCYGRLVCNPDDDEAFRRIVNYPARGIGNTTLQKLQAGAATAGVSLWQAAEHSQEYGIALGTAATRKVQGFLALIRSFQEKIATIGAYELTDDIVKRSGIDTEISKERTAESLARQENVEELRNSIRAAEIEALEERGETLLPLPEFLSTVSLLSDTEAQNENTPAVTLMTVHAAKGLEFDTVFITGMEDELFPSDSARLYPKDMEEERRLFYVAVTRAKNHCFLSYAKSRFRYGTTEFHQPSCFLYEIDPKYVDNLDNPTPFSVSTQHQPQKATPDFSQSKAYTTKYIPSPTSSIDRPTNLGKLAPGCRIAHERFGKGTITNISGTGDAQKICVEFDNVGTKNLLIKFAKFTKLPQ